MSKTSLFSNAPAKSKNLVEFKAGKMTIDDKNWVHADKRKGLAYIHLGTDGLTHFCWKDRNSGIVEDDLIVFPDDTEFMKIPKCTTGRVYVLKFKNSKNLFLWLQEPKTERDDEICKKVNTSLNMLRGKRISNGRDSEVQEFLSGLGSGSYPISQNEMMTLLGMASGTGTAASESGVSSRASSARPSFRTTGTRAGKEMIPISETPSSSQNQFKINELRSVLSNFKSDPAKKAVTVDLNDVINSSSVLPLLDKPDNWERLESMLPSRENVDLIQHLKENVQSPQMHAAVKSFGQALQSGDLGPVVAQFGLGEDVNKAAISGCLRQFAKVLESTMKPFAVDTVGQDIEEGKQEGDEPMEQE